MTDAMNAFVELSGPARSQKPTDRPALDESLRVLSGKAREFARLTVDRKLALLRALQPRLRPVAEGWVADACRAKGIDGPVSGEEWLAGPNCTARNIRLLIQSLEALQASGQIGLDERAVTRREDGRFEVRVFPTDAMDAVLIMGFSISQLMLPGLGLDEIRARQGAFYRKRDPEGGVSLVLGGGNVSSIPPMDVLYKMFVEGHVCLLKMNPVNEWVGPHLEALFAPIIEAGYLRIVYGGGDVGAHLVTRDEVTDVHITGSNHTHDLIVWGPPGPERDRRRAARDPLLKKTISSELGNVSPIAIVPAEYSPAEIDFLAENLVSMVTNNGSFNCNAGKLIITSSSWPQRRALLDRMGEIFASTPTRRAFYPGAAERYERLTRDRELKQYGAQTSTHLPWTIVLGVDSERADDPIFSVEPFCSIISETTLDASEPADFIARAARFMNERVWGTLNTTIILPPRIEARPEVKAALERAILDLRYGTVAINHWPGIVYGLASPAWGGHPSATLEDIQSGLGWVHNTGMLEGIEKTVLRGPFLVKPKPPWFVGNRKLDVLARRLFDLEVSPSWLKVPGIALTAMGG